MYICIMPAPASSINYDSLPPFGSTTECLKCGGQQMFRRYTTRIAAGGHPLRPETVELMQVKCGGCGYDQMTEKTKDAPEPEQAPKCDECGFPTDRHFIECSQTTAV